MMSRMSKKDDNFSKLKFSLVASLRLVSPGAATDGVTLFFLKKLTTFFSRRSLKSDDLFSCRLLTTSTLSAFPSDVVPQKFISFGCHPSVSKLLFN